MIRPNTVPVQEWTQAKAGACVLVALRHGVKPREVRNRLVELAGVTKVNVITGSFEIVVTIEDRAKDLVMRSVRKIIEDPAVSSTLMLPFADPDQAIT